MRERWGMGSRGRLQQHHSQVRAAPRCRRLERGCEDDCGARRPDARVGGGEAVKQRTRVGGAAARREGRHNRPRPSPREFECERECSCGTRAREHGCDAHRALGLRERIGAHESLRCCSCRVDAAACGARVCDGGQQRWGKARAHANTHSASSPGVAKERGDGRFPHLQRSRTRVQIPRLSRARAHPRSLSPSR